MKENPRSARQRALWAARERSRQRIQSDSSTTPPARPPHKRSWVLRSALVIVLLIAVGGGVFGYKIIAASDTISDTERSILGQLKDLLFQSGHTLAGETDNRVNVLLIAVGGAGHKGEDLADTIMVASIRPNDSTAALLSIPRDLYVQVPRQEYYSKINAVHAYGESQKNGEGPRLLKELTEEITGLPIHYYVRVDFTAFKGIVDAVGGVNIAIDNSFYDYWHKISFPAGTEKMNGERTLAYVRARYIEGPEGGDFKRAARQQQVLLALREKVFSVQTALDFTRTNAILNSLSDNIRTDMQLWEMKRFYELARLIEPAQVKSIVLTSGLKGVLTGGTEILGGVPASVLRPRTGDYSEIQQIAQSIFTVEPTQNTNIPAVKETPPPSATPTPPAAKPSLEIRNGTNITGLAKNTSNRLAIQDYDILAINNASQRNHTKTTIYIISDDQADSAKELAATLGFPVDSGLPEGESPTSADVLIILGSDAE